MKKKIFIIFYIISLIFSYSKVFAETGIKEEIEGSFPNYNTNAEYKLEIKDSTNKKIVVKFKNMTIIESYAENNNGKLDLKALSRITYSEPNDIYFLHIEFITDSEYQLDYNNQYQYSIYLDGKLKKEVKTEKASIDKTKEDKENIYYKFYIDSDIDINQIFIFGIKIYVVIYILVLGFCIYQAFYGMKHLESKKYGGMVNEKNVDYYREIPELSELEISYASLYYCSKINRKKLKKGIIGAFILKWANEDNILIIDKGNKVFSIDLQDGNFEKTEIEQELYNLLKIAAGNNNKIDNTELKIWSRSNKDALEKWHKKILENVSNENLRPKAEKILGLKKYLLDYSIIDEKRHIEVKIWENYLIYAQLLGISDKVNKQFVKIYPDYSKIGQLSVMNSYDILVEIQMGYFAIVGFLLIPMGIALPITLIISILCYWGRSFLTIFY